MLWQPSLPERYHQMTSAHLAEEITQRRQRLGDALVILVHHYQVDQVHRHADLTGDSLQLSQDAARVAQERGDTLKTIIFCGVHFMAETADILTPDSVSVILPDLSAGCSMADMAEYDDAADAWTLIHEAIARENLNARVIPITYVNSSAAIKAFVGQNGGACCTSSNADAVFEWAMKGGTKHAEPGEEIKILFLPDQHLGRNTAVKFGLDAETQAVLYEPRKTRKGEGIGGLDDADIARASVILWAGHCSVHKLFRPEHCAQIRAADDAARRENPSHEPTTILVHPECAKEVVDLADLQGSTGYIIKQIESAPPGSRWAVGTEHNLVNRLSGQAKERGVEVRILSDCQCLCTTMYRIDEPHLLWILDQLVGIDPTTGEERGPEHAKQMNVVQVHPEAKRLAVLAVDRMMSLGTGAPTR